MYQDCHEFIYINKFSMNKTSSIKLSDNVLFLLLVKLLNYFFKTFNSFDVSSKITKFLLELNNNLVLVKLKLLTIC